jgi:hypothetical protein
MLEIKEIDNKTKQLEKELNKSSKEEEVEEDLEDDFVVLDKNAQEKKFSK